MKNLHKNILVFSSSFCLLFSAFGQMQAKNVLDIKHSIEDNAIVYPESYETDTQKLLERWYLKNYTTSDIESTSPNDPGATDEEIKARLAALPTVIDMPFNSIVKSYIERYTKKGRKQVTALLGLASYYMPIFEQALEQNGLPLELKYLPVIESGLDPTATSKSGAAGLWQFIPASARGYDMELSSLVDERRDPYVSTDRACRLLHDLYETYNDWSLAIAAYNCGPGTVNKALQRAGGDASAHDFWSIYYYLPEETRGYVPMFIAANYVMEYYPEHDICPVLPTKPLITNTVQVSDRVHFEQIAAVLDIPIEEIRILNPQFRADIIPATASRPYNLILPSQQIHAYIVSEDQILSYESEKYARKTEAEPGNSNVAAVEVESIAPLNPANPAPVEAEAAELAFEETHPVQAAIPTRRRTTTPTAPQQTTQKTAPVTKPAATKVVASTSTTPVTPAQKATTPKKTETTAKASAATTKKAANNSTATTKKQEPAATKTANNTKKQETAAASNTKKQTKKQETAPANNTKKQTKKQETASANTKKKAEANKPSEHTVVNGDNLSKIAQKNGVTVEQLKKANPKIKSDVIHPGDKISIPKKSAKADNKTQTKSTAASNNKAANNNNAKKGKKK